MYIDGKQIPASSNSTIGIKVRLCLPPRPRFSHLTFFCTSKHWKSYKEDSACRIGEETVWGYLPCKEKLCHGKLMTIIGWGNCVMPQHVWGGISARLLQWLPYALRHKILLPLSWQARHLLIGHNLSAWKEDCLSTTPTGWLLSQ